MREPDPTGTPALMIEKENTTTATERKLAEK
jgi:hypothetical protein